jgi:hypothetical protein
MRNNEKIRLLEDRFSYPVNGLGIELKTSEIHPRFIFPSSLRVQTGQDEPDELPLPFPTMIFIPTFKHTSLLDHEKLL